MFPRLKDSQLSLAAAILFMVALAFLFRFDDRLFPSVSAQAIVQVSSAADITGDGAAHALQSSKTTARWVVVISASTNSAVIRLGGSTTSSSQGAAIAVGGGFMYPPIPAGSVYYDLNALYYYAATGDKLTVIWGR